MDEEITDFGLNSTENNTRKQLTLYMGVGLVFVLAILFCTVAYCVSSFVKSDRICKGIVVCGNEIGGMTRSQAETVLREYARKRMNERITLTALDTKWSGELFAFGVNIKWRESLDKAYKTGRDGSFFNKARHAFANGSTKINIDAVTAVDDAVLLKLTEKVASAVNSPASDAKFQAKDGKLIIKQEILGKKLNKKESMNIIKDAIAAGKVVIPLSLEVDMPKIKAEDLKKINTLLGSYTTRYNPGNVSRTHNVSLAAKAINGTVILPGEVFSYNKTVGPREARYGFREAKIFVAGDVEPGIGGGICQVSTTLYNSVLLADLKVRERYNHSRLVDYVPAGLDATVSYGSRDFRFENSNDTAVAIITKMGKGSLTIDIYGDAKDKKDVKIYTGGKSYGKAGGRKTIADPTLPEGKEIVEERGARSVYVTSYKKIGNGEAKVIARNTYPARKTIVKVGTKKAEEPVEQTTEE